LFIYIGKQKLFWIQISKCEIKFRTTFVSRTTCIQNSNSGYHSSTPTTHHQQPTTGNTILHKHCLATPLLQPQQHCCCLPIPPPTTPTQAAAKQLRLSDTLTPAFVMNLHVPSTLPSPSFVLLPSEAVQFSRMNFMLLGMITTFKIQNSNMIIMIMMVWL
jgi:hypothetical protein